MKFWKLLGKGVAIGADLAASKAEAEAYKTELVELSRKYERLVATLAELDAERHEHSQRADRQEQRADEAMIRVKRLEIDLAEANDEIKRLRAALTNR